MCPPVVVVLRDTYEDEATWLIVANPHKALLTPWPLLDRKGMVVLRAQRIRQSPSFSENILPLLVCIGRARCRQVGMEVWSVLGLSLLIDGYVLVKTFEGIWESKPKNVSLKKHLKNVSRGLLYHRASSVGTFVAVVAVIGWPSHEASLYRQLYERGVVITLTKLVVSYFILVGGSRLRGFICRALTRGGVV